VGLWGLECGCLVANIRQTISQPVKTPAFKTFLLGWMILHGFYMLALMRWVPIWYWSILTSLELFTAFVTAYRLFGAMPDHGVDVDKWGGDKKRELKL
jgi:hypothetical protein